MSSREVTRETRPEPTLGALASNTSLISLWRMALEWAASLPPCGAAFGRVVEMGIQNSGGHQAGEKTMQDP